MQYIKNGDITANSPWRCHGCPGELVGDGSGHPYKLAFGNAYGFVITCDSGPFSSCSQCVMQSFQHATVAQKWNEVAVTPPTPHRRFNRKKSYKDSTATMS
jgi:hypothetical protein